jgi:hypothetical protein
MKRNYYAFGILGSLFLGVAFLVGSLQMTMNHPSKLPQEITLENYATYIKTISINNSVVSDEGTRTFASSDYSIYVDIHYKRYVEGLWMKLEILPEKEPSRSLVKEGENPVFVSYPQKLTEYISGWAIDGSLIYHGSIEFSTDIVRQPLTVHLLDIGGKGYYEF